MTLAAPIPLKHDFPFTPLLMTKPRRTDVLAREDSFSFVPNILPYKETTVFRGHHHLAGKARLCLISFTAGLE